MLPWPSSGSSTLQFRAERIKMPPTRYQRAAGSDRGTLECVLLFKSAANQTHPLPHPQGPSLTRSAAARRHPCLPSTWIRRPLPAANHRAPSPTRRAFLSAPLQLVTEGRTGKATPPSILTIITPAPPSSFDSTTSCRQIARQAMNFAAVAEGRLFVGDLMLLPES